MRLETVPSEIIGAHARQAVGQLNATNGVVPLWGNQLNVTQQPGNRLTVDTGMYLIDGMVLINNMPAIDINAPTQDGTYYLFLFGDSGRPKQVDIVFDTQDLSADNDFMFDIEAGKKAHIKLAKIVIDAGSIQEITMVAPQAAGAVALVYQMTKSLNTHINGAPASHITSGVFGTAMIPHISAGNGYVQLNVKEPSGTYQDGQLVLFNTGALEMRRLDSASSFIKMFGVTANGRAYAFADAAADGELTRYGQLFDAGQNKLKVSVMPYISLNNADYGILTGGVAGQYPVHEVVAYNKRSGVSGTPIWELRNKTSASTYTRPFIINDNGTVETAADANADAHLARYGQFRRHDIIATSVNVPGTITVPNHSSYQWIVLTYRVKVAGVNEFNVRTIHMRRAHVYTSGYTYKDSVAYPPNANQHFMVTVDGNNTTGVLTVTFTKGSHYDTCVVDMVSGYKQ